MIIEVKDLVIKYKNLTAVKGISFGVQKGEIFGMIGPNGAGKTSTIECLEGLRKAESGSVLISGISPQNRKKLYNLIGVQLQETNFADVIKVGELCRLFSSFYENPADYKALLARFGLEGRENSYVKKLSGGQRQKVAIVVALIANPEILFLDELTTGLDPQARINMWELIKSLRDEGRTIFMTTHFMDEAEYLCDRVCLMTDGRIKAIGTISELIEEADLDRKILLSSQNISKEEIMKLCGTDHVRGSSGRFEIYGKDKTMLKNLVVYMAENNIEYDDLTASKPGLEDVFLKLAGSELKIHSGEE